VDFLTVAQADTIGARTIAIATSAESIVRSSGKRGNLRRAISAVAPVRSMQITVRGAVGLVGSCDRSACSEFEFARTQAAHCHPRTKAWLIPTVDDHRESASVFRAPWPERISRSAWWRMER
jgi:hypothetical protein